MNTPHTCPKCGALLPADAPEGLCPACLMSGGLATDAVTVKLTPSQKPSAPAPLTTPTPEELAPYFPNLEILELLGRGGMGMVYKARQKTLNRLVALKILPVEPDMDDHFAERFQREAQALARLNHPNIVTVYEVGEAKCTGSADSPVGDNLAVSADKTVGAPSLFYFLMEFVDGANLRTLIRSGEMKPQAALALIPAFCDALQYAHDEGVVHRDIKPENVLVNKKGQVKIADFGLAKLLGHETTDHSLTLSGMTLGTPRYMAPEQMDKPETVDHRADIYSLGVVFYEMLTGEIPMGRFAPPSQKVQVDVRFDEIVLHALERDVTLRYQHASEIKTDVQNVTGSQRVAQVPSSTPTPERAAAVHAARFRDLPADLKRVPLKKLLAVIAGYVVLMVFGVATIYRFFPRPIIEEFGDFATPLGDYNAMQFRSLDIKGEFYGTYSEEGARSYESRRTMPLTLKLWRKDGSSCTLTVDLPSLRANPDTGGSFLLDREELLRWMKDVGRLDPADAKLVKEAGEITALLKRYTSSPPVTLQEFRTACREELKDFRYEDGDFAFKRMGHGGDLQTNLAFGAWILVLSAIGLSLARWIKRAAVRHGLELAAAGAITLPRGLVPATPSHTDTLENLKARSVELIVGGIALVLSGFISFAVGASWDVWQRDKYAALGLAGAGTLHFLAGIAAINGGIFMRRVRFIGFSFAAAWMLCVLPFTAFLTEITLLKVAAIPLAFALYAGVRAVIVLFKPETKAAFDAVQAQSSGEADPSRWHALNLAVGLTGGIAAGIALFWGFSATGMGPGLPWRFDILVWLPGAFAAFGATVLLIKSSSSGRSAVEDVIPEMALAALGIGVGALPWRGLDHPFPNPWDNLVGSAWESGQGVLFSLTYLALGLFLLVTGGRKSRPAWRATLTLLAGIVALVIALHFATHPAKPPPDGFWHMPNGTLVTTLTFQLCFIGSFVIALLTVVVGAMQLRNRPNADDEARTAALSLEATSEPRLSPLALWGAILAVPGITTWIVMLRVMVIETSNEGAWMSGGGKLEWGNTVTFPGGPAVFALIIILGIGSLIASTILGRTAIAQIKNSGGKLYGLPLATFASMLIPLLGLGTVALVMTHIVQIVFWTQTHMGYSYDGQSGRLINPIAPNPASRPIMTFILFDALAFCATFFFAGRMAWRKIVVGELQAAGQPDGANFQSLGKSDTGIPVRINDEPRLSPLALWGAIWAGVGILALALTVILETVVASAVVNRMPAGERQPLWLLLLAVAFGLIAASAPIGTTILGFIGIGQIKRSGGKLYGLRLAAADAIFFPLLLVGAVAFYITNLIAAGIAFNLRPLVPGDAEGVSVISFAVLDALIVLVVCFFVGRKAWRAIVGQPAAPANRIKPTVENNEPRLSRLALWGVILVAVSVLAFVGVMFTGTVVFDHLFTTHYFAPNIPPLGVRIAEWILGTLGVLTGTAGTLCGFASVSAIRKSDGRLQGLPLAAATALFLPLLLLGTVTTFGGYGAVNAVLDSLRPSPSKDGPPPQAGVGAVYLVPVALAVCFFVGRKAWRAIVGQPAAPANEIKSAVDNNEPRLSRCALIGAIWAPCVLNAWWAWQHCVRQYFDRAEQFASYSGPYLTLGITAAILAGTAPLGATILGGSAMAQIKRSAGKLYGLPLAGFALLFQPLVILALFTAYLLKPHALFLWFDGWRGMSPNEIADMREKLGDGLSFSRFDIVVILVVCGLAGWFAWRKISGARAGTKG